MDVTLRPIEDDDLPVLFAQMQDTDAQHMAAFTHEDPSDRAAFDAHWAKLRASGTVLPRTVLVDGDVAGSITSFLLFDGRDITYWIGRDFWGRGVATAALRAFLEVEPTRPLSARVAHDNTGSQRVLEKCGFERTGRDRYFAHARGAEIEEWIYTLR